MDSLPPILACDFDGTITKYNEFPHCGEIMPGAVEIINKLHDMGCKIIIWTARMGVSLDAAIHYCNTNGIPYHSVNKNIDEVEDLFFPNPDDSLIHVPSHYCRKVFANYYIDDLNLGGFPGWQAVHDIVVRDWGHWFEKRGR